MNVKVFFWANNINNLYKMYSLAFFNLREKHIDLIGIFLNLFSKDNLGSSNVGSVLKFYRGSNGSDSSKLKRQTL